MTTGNPLPQWIDLSTPDMPGALKFYGCLFGWEFHDTGYELIAHLGGRPVCGMWPIESDASGSRSYWHVFHGVSQLDHALSTAVAQGAEVLLAPIDYRGVSTAATLRDPAGATFSLWERRTGWPFLAGVAGALVWVELAVGAPRQIAHFYRATLDLTTGNVRTADEDYRVFASKGQPVAGVVQNTADPRWRIYFATSDINRAIGQVEGLGGQVVSTPAEIGVGAAALIRDPSGAMFGLLETARIEPGGAADDNAGYPIGLSL